jgi:hypothetical protein
MLPTRALFLQRYCLLWHSNYWTTKSWISTTKSENLPLHYDSLFHCTVQEISCCFPSSVTMHCSTRTCGRITHRNCN